MHLLVVSLFCFPYVRLSGGVSVYQFDKIHRKKNLFVLKSHKFKYSNSCSKSFVFACSYFISGYVVAVVPVYSTLARMFSSRRCKLHM